jgi:hypothetical protein
MFIFITTINRILSLFNPIMHKIRLQFPPLLQIASKLHYKHESINVAHRQSFCPKNRAEHTNSLWAKRTVFNVKTDGTYTNQCALKFQSSS